MEFTAENSQPIIIVGMHRSGTNLLTQILRDAGIFMGALREGNNESKVYLMINERIFKLLNATWDDPKPVVKELLKEDVVMAYRAAVKCWMTPVQSILYWGPGHLSHFLNPPSEHWGWKDPRTTFTWPIWHSLYPNCKFIHMVRNGIDVAESLRVREHKRLRNLNRMKHFSGRCLSIEGGFSLWEEYVKNGIALENVLPKQCLRVKYEDLLEKPQENIHAILKFIDKANNKDLTQRIISRNFAREIHRFQVNEKLVRFYNENKKNYLLEQLGYVNLT
jgi:hypothetical protein